MNKFLEPLCTALKKIAENIHPFENSFSFILLVGKKGQGKTALLNQGPLKHFKTDFENGVNFFYNNTGIFLELGDTWLHQNENLLTDTVKELNRCHKSIRISGLVLCVDSSELLKVEPLHLADLCKAHAQLLLRFGSALGYPVEASIMLTKLDALVGFTEFFQSEHENERNKPLGFSLSPSREKRTLLRLCQLQCDRMIETLAQQIIKKLHPARSGAKRTLIREFPLQLASLRTPIQSLLASIPHQNLHITSIYLTSAEQGGISIDRLNKKIQHEYALTVPDKFPQSHNYRPYFIHDALVALQQHSLVTRQKNYHNEKKIMGAMLGLAFLSLSYIGYKHVQSSYLLDEASKEMLTYETLLSQNDRASALYHLSLAEVKMGGVSRGLFLGNHIDQLNSQLKSNAANKLHTLFVPSLLEALEEAIKEPSKGQLAQYQALKMYQMLGDPKHLEETEVIAWFREHWKLTSAAIPSEDNAVLLLKRILKKPFQPIVINSQLVRDTRNYLNAMPGAYLYYSLAKESFLKEQALPIQVEGFQLAANEVPYRFTRKGFQKITTELPAIAKSLQQDNWVLARSDLNNLEEQLIQAYCFEYLTWWQNFTRKTQPLHYQNYQEAQLMTSKWRQTEAISHLIHLIQENTKPGLSSHYALFNKKIASEFSSINLISSSAGLALYQSIDELEKFLSTLALIQDRGQTIFDLTKSRFQGNTQTDPLSALYNQARQLPEPVSIWAKQIADDSWFMFINESREYLNKAWAEHVFKPYMAQIARRYPIDPSQKAEINLNDFDAFFAPRGTLNAFVNQNIKPFLDTNNPQWQPKELNGYMLPISNLLINELIRANVISNMFFPNNATNSKIEFSLQKINLDPVVAHLTLTLGNTALEDSQDTDSLTSFIWPEENAKLFLKSIDGNHFELEETGIWAFFRLLQKVNVLVDNEDSASLQILFEINGNSGRYLLKTQNQINPFSPGILTGFNLDRDIA